MISSNCCSMGRSPAWRLSESCPRRWRRAETNQRYSCRRPSGPRLPQLVHCWEPGPAKVPRNIRLSNAVPSAGPYRLGGTGARRPARRPYTGGAACGAPVSQHYEAKTGRLRVWSPEAGPNHQSRMGGTHGWTDPNTPHRHRVAVDARPVRPQGQHGPIRGRFTFRRESVMFAPTSGCRMRPLPGIVRGQGYRRPT